MLSRRHFPDGGLVQPSEWNRPTDGGLPDHLDKVAIFGVVVSHKDEIKRCVKLQKESAPERTGTAVMHWVVQGNGDVRDVECATAETENTVMDKCMRSIVSRWKFPTSRCGQVVDFPFKF